MKSTFINKLNKMVNIGGGEIEFYGTMRVGDGYVVKISKNKIHIEKDKIIEIFNTRECIIYFDDFIEMHGIAKFVGICEMANLKIPDYVDEDIDYEELINKILTIAENSNFKVPATKKIISLINQYKND